MHRVGIDTGGTFTDVTYVGPGGEVRTLKTPTTDDLLSGVRTGLHDILDEAGLPADELEYLSHGSTVAVNTIIERTGATTAVVTNEGFRDRLEIGQLYRPPELVYDPKLPQSDPLVPRRYRFEVAERLDADGNVLEPLTDADLDEIVETVQEAPIDSVAVCLLHSYKNPEAETRIAAALAERTDRTVSVSSDLSGEIGEYERMATAVVDAYIKPEVSQYLRVLRERLDEDGVDIPIHVMQSEGGLARSSLVADEPITALLSGPIAGITAAKHYGAQAGVNDFISFDMGGTSCDASLVVDGEPTEDATREIEELQVKGPFTTLETIGAGGGSIAWIDDNDVLRVGPRSAGANPGPACYGRGGTKPTVTDADLVLGLLNPEFFAGGGLDLDEQAARRAIETVADPLGLSVAEAALAIQNIVNEKMAGAARVVSVEQGYDPRNFSLVAYGGAGPLHAVPVADIMGMDSVVIPNHPGLTSSLGLLLADVRHTFNQSITATVSDIDIDATEQTFGSLEHDATVTLDDEDVSEGNRTFVRTVDARYAGQEHTLNVAIDRPIDAEGIRRASEKFESQHDRIYGFRDETSDIEFVNARITAVGTVDRPDLTVSAETRDESLASVRRESRVVVDGPEEVGAARYRWRDVCPRDVIDGPAVIEQPNSTVWIPMGYEGTVDEYKNIIITEFDQ